LINITYLAFIEMPFCKFYRAYVKLALGLRYTASVHLSIRHITYGLSCIKLFTPVTRLIILVFFYQTL